MEQARKTDKSFLGVVVVRLEKVRVKEGIEQEPKR